MQRWIFAIILVLIFTGCNAYISTYADFLASQLPEPTSGRTLHIPALDVNVDVMTFPLGETTWEISPWERNAGRLDNLGWITYPGNTVIAAHSEYPSGVAGVFSELHTLQIGDVVFVRDGDLQRAYIVHEIHTVDYRDLSVVYPTTDHRLTLMTCSIPSYVAAQNLYYERVVVIAQPIEG